MTPQHFITALEQQQVIHQDLAEVLRAKAAADTRLTPDAILKFLLSQDVLSAWKAEELRLELLASPAEEPEILELMPLPEFDEETELREPLDPSGPPPGPWESRPAPFAPERGDANFDDAAGSPPARKSGASGKTPQGVYKLGGGEKKKGKKRTAGGRNQWDSPLLLLGGGGLVVLLVAGVFLYFLLFREGADAVMSDANNLFDRGAYPQAIVRYEEFVAKFSNHQDASRARVRLEMTRLWNVVENSADPAAALAEAQRAIGEIEDEPAFQSGGEGDEGLSSAQQELGALLTRIGQALVTRAEQSSDDQEIAELIKRLEVVLALSANKKYVPDQVRNTAELAKISEALAVIRARQQRDTYLAATLGRMDSAIAVGNPAAAFAERLTLLSEHPSLASEESLGQRVRAACAAEQQQVKFVTDARPAEKSWPAKSVVAELALAERRHVGAGARPGGEPVVVRVDGALYGLSSSDGALLWRRFAGMGPTSAPLKVGDSVIAANLHRGELWRLKASTGELVWRLPLDDQVTGVTALGKHLLASGDAGRLYVVDADSGALAGRVTFTQPLRSAPAINDRGDRIYVVAGHSIIYTLSAEDFSCVGVYYAGHAAGAVVARPVCVLDKVVIADNSGADICRIRVLTTNREGVIEGEAASERLEGLVITPMARASRRIAAATTSGHVAVFDVSGAADAASLTPVARREGKERAPLARFSLLHQGNLWLAGRELSKLAILPTENQLSVRGIDRDFRGDAFDDSLQSVGDLVIHVRRPQGRAGAVVAATHAAENATAWETEIAVPLAGPPAVDAARLQVTAVAASGAAYVLDRQSLTRGVQDEALRPSTTQAPSQPPWTDSVAIDGGRLVASSAGQSELLLVAPDEPRATQSRLITLPSPLSGPLAMWDQRLVAPTAVGQVFLLDLASGAPVGTPFQPAMQPAQTIAWLEPAPTADAPPGQLVLSDGVQHLYLVEQRAQPVPHLAEVAATDLGPAPLEGRLALLNNVVFAATTASQMASFSLPQLAPGEPVELGGRIAWGPFTINDVVLAGTDADELIAIGSDRAIRWRRPLKHGPVAGRPLASDGSVLLLHSRGRLSRVDLATGAEAAYSDLEQPAVAGPVPIGPRVIVVAPDGALLVVNRP